jgi:hypothetical protein
VVCLPRGFALPIKKVREYPGFSTGQLAGMLGSFHPPQGYTLVDKYRALADVCDKLMSDKVVRELIVQHSAPVT